MIDWSSDVCSSDLTSPARWSMTRPRREIGGTPSGADRDRRFPVASPTRGSRHRLGGGAAGLFHPLAENGLFRRFEIGRASSRERVCLYVMISLLVVT